MTERLLTLGERVRQHFDPPTGAESYRRRRVTTLRIRRQRCRGRKR